MAHILVVDDQAPVRLTIRIGLEQAGHTVADAADGQEGLDQLDGQTFDLAIVDVVMPRMGGVEFIKAARMLRPEMPILAISGGGGPMPAAYSLTMTEMFGAAGVLFKPFTPDELRVGVDRLLSPGP